MNTIYSFERLPGVALYQQIKDMLRAEVAFVPYGEQIPSEQQLMEQYGVSRGPIRQAISELVHEGVLYRMHGRGTFRAGGTVNHSHFELKSLTEQLLHSGMIPGIRDVNLQSVIPPAFVSRYLHLDGFTEAWELSRIRLADGEPITFSRGYIPKDIVPKLNAGDLEMSIVNMLCGTYKLVFASTRSLCSARNADEFIAEKLNIAPGYAVLHIEFVACNAQGHPVFADITDAVGQKYVMRVEQRKYEL